MSSDRNAPMRCSFCRKDLDERTFGRPCPERTGKKMHEARCECVLVESIGLFFPTGASMKPPYGGCDIHGIGTRRVR